MRLIDADALLSRLKQPTVEDINEVLRVEYDNAPNDVLAAEAVYNMYESVREAIEDAPTIESPRDWTPCADGLPEEGQEVLFETALQVPATDYFGTYKGFYSDGIFWIDNVMHEKKFGISKQSVIAWQPLPAPYRANDTTGKVKEDAE